MKKFPVVWLVAAGLLVLLAVLTPRVVRMFPAATSPSDAPLAQSAPPPPAALTAPTQALSSASVSVPAARAKVPLTEKRFVEISATVVLGAEEVQNRPDAAQLLAPLLQKTLDEAGVSIEDFNAYGAVVKSDPRLQQRIANEIAKRVAERSTPQQGAQAGPMARSLNAKLGNPPPAH